MNIRGANSRWVTALCRLRQEHQEFKVTVKNSLGYRRPCSNGKARHFSDGLLSGHRRPGVACQFGISVSVDRPKTSTLTLA